MSHKDITHYFKVSKSANSIPCVENTNSSEGFYKECLKEQMQKQNCCINTCVEEMTRLQKMLDDKKEKLRQVERSISVCKRICNTKDNLIESLKTKLSTTPAPPSKSTVGANPKIPLQEFSSNFNDSQLSEFRSFGSGKNHDSSFVNFVVRQVYAEDLHKLNFISLTGRCRAGEKKEIMSPSKKKLICDVFYARLDDVEKSKEPREARKKNINVLVKTAINNIRNQTKKSTQKVIVYLPE